MPLLTLRRLSGRVALVSLAGCGPQSALNFAGTDAAEIGRLFYVMLGSAAAIWILVMGAAVWGVLRAPSEHTERHAKLLIVVGGVIFPTLVLALLLGFGLRLLERDPVPEGTLRVEVHGEQWWWRVRYEAPEGGVTVTANEIRLPAGRPVELRLTAAEVIHSFWIPSLGGKMDMIPGRENRLVLNPERPGLYRGACAEFCGTSHALMAFAVVVEEPEEFEAWLAREAAPAAPEDTMARGRELFLGAGCGGCHRVRGIVELGEVGPDLTHVGGRRTIGAGLAETSVETLASWIAAPSAMKPGVHMPGYAMLPEADIRAIAEFLYGLK